MPQCRISFLTRRLGLPNFRMFSLKDYSGKGNPLIPQNPMEKLTNSCTYTLYFDDIDTPPDQEFGKNTISKLKEKAKECIGTIEPLVDGYLWHVEAFHLVLDASDSDEKKARHLHGKVEFGDCVDDEWFIVFLLMYISKEIPNLSISIDDNDGEFLLIETANHLPEWLTPDTSQNRVFIRGGELHIVPLPQTPAEICLLPTTPSLQDSLRLMATHPKLTRASNAVNNALIKRVCMLGDGFGQVLDVDEVSGPARISVNVKSVHQAACRLPSIFALCLKQQPQLVASAVRALADRISSMSMSDDMNMNVDVDAAVSGESSSRIILSESKSDGETERDFVTIPIRFSRVTYALMVSQPVPLDEREVNVLLALTGGKGGLTFDFGLPPVNRTGKGQGKDKEYRAWIDGYALTCGLLLLLQKQKQNSTTDSGSGRDSESESDVKWTSFLKSLKNHGYFGDFIAGSKPYNELMEKARSSFDDIVKRREQRAERERERQRCVYVPGVPKAVVGGKGKGNEGEGEVWYNIASLPSSSASVLQKCVERNEMLTKEERVRLSLSESKDTTTATATTASSDLKWLEGAPEYLEEYLATQSSELAVNPLSVGDMVDDRFSEGEGEGEEVKVNMSHIVEEVESFLDRPSTHEGVEMKSKVKVKVAVSPSTPFASASQNNDDNGDDDGYGDDDDAASEAGSDVSVDINEDRVMFLLKSVLDGGGGGGADADRETKDNARTETEETEADAISHAHEQELSTTTIADTFGQADPRHSLVENVLSGLTAEAERGGSGPLSSLLGSLGVHLPRAEDGEFEEKH